MGFLGCLASGRTNAAIKDSAADLIRWLRVSPVGDCMMQRYGREKAFWHYNRYITPVKAAPGAERNFKKSFLGVKNGKIWGEKLGGKRG